MAKERPDRLPVGPALVVSNYRRRLHLHQPIRSRIGGNSKVDGRSRRLLSIYPPIPVLPAELPTASRTTQVGRGKICRRREPCTSRPTAGNPASCNAQRGTQRNRKRGNWQPERHNRIRQAGSAIQPAWIPLEESPPGGLLPTEPYRRAGWPVHRRPIHRYRTAVRLPASPAQVAAPLLSCRRSIRWPGR